MDWYEIIIKKKEKKKKKKREGMLVIEELKVNLFLYQSHHHGRVSLYSK